MDRTAITEQVQEIVRSVLKNDSVVISDETTAHDVEGWDSMADVMITEEVKKHFNIRIPLREMVAWDCVGDMINSIEKKI